MEVTTPSPEVIPPASTRWTPAWIYPLVFLILSLILALEETIVLATQHSHQTLDKHTYPLGDFFLGALAFNSVSVFPAGCAIAITLMLLQKQYNAGKMITMKKAFLLPFPVGIAAIVASSALLSLCIYISPYTAYSINQAGLAAVGMLMMLPIFGFFGIVCSIVLGLLIAWKQSWRVAHFLLILSIGCFEVFAGYTSFMAWYQASL